MWKTIVANGFQKQSIFIDSGDESVNCNGPNCVIPMQRLSDFKWKIMSFLILLVITWERLIVIPEYCLFRTVYRINFVYLESKKNVLNMESLYIVWELAKLVLLTKNFTTTNMAC